MKWGDSVDFLIDVSVERGEMTPSLRSMPSLSEEDKLFWDAFTYLSRTRRWSLRFGKNEMQYILPDSILLSEVEAYCNLFGFVDVEQRARLARIVFAVDSAYLEEVKKNVGV